MDNNEALKWVIPVNRSGLAIAAGYTALFSIFALPAPIALILGILALRDIKKNPKKLGKGRAWFGIIVGGIFTIIILAAIIAAIFSNNK